MQINPQDFRIDIYNTGGNWFPIMNGIAITHILTGLIECCGTERGQHANKHLAFERLLKRIEGDTDYYKQMELF